VTWTETYDEFRDGTSADAQILEISSRGSYIDVVKPIPVGTERNFAFVQHRGPQVRHKPKVRNMRLALRNLLHDPTRLVVTSLGVAFAVFLMIFQSSLLIGFLRAAAEIIDATDSDLWIAPRGVVCFDFSSTLDSRWREIAQGVSGVESANPMTVAFVGYRMPEGQHRIVVLIGADPKVGLRFPLPYLPGSQGALEPEGILIDETNAQELEIAAVPSDVEINGLRAHIAGIVRGFSSFLGSPYVFASYEDAARYSRLGWRQVSYLTVKVAPGSDALAVRDRLAGELPEADIWTHAQFRRRSQMYWIGQTGAGAAILTAAILAFLIGLVLVSQTIYATTMEHLEEFATLKALGASKNYVVKIVITQALAFGIAGGIFGVLSAIPVVQLARNLVAWIYSPWWLVPMVLVPAFLMCGLASIASIRTALSVEPARVFRA
jgi:putative ABC transport system permease protein